MSGCQSYGRFLDQLLAFLAKMASVGFLAHLGLLAILVSLDCKALQDWKDLQGNRAPLGGLACLDRA